MAINLDAINLDTIRRDLFCWRLQMAINLDALRRDLLLQAGLKAPALKQLRGDPSITYVGTVKLPTDFSTHGNSVLWESDDLTRNLGSKSVYRVKVMSHSEAMANSKTTAKHPHRILIYCEYCGGWIFAGKLVQHQKFCKRAADAAYDKLAKGGV
jgi:hypothetical protein